MVGREAQISRPHTLILGLILTYHTTLTSCVQESSACKNLTSQYQHCRIHPAGVHDLDCFAKGSTQNMKCVWKPGKHTAQKTYTLLIQQRRRNYCKLYSNITQGYEKITIFSSENLTAEIFETSDSANCTKAVFRGSANKWMRCGPPYNVSFWRHAGKLDVSVSWLKDDRNFITKYSVQYKTLNSQSWNKTVQCQKEKTCTVGDLNSSLVYNVQIQCVTNKKCSQCPWSQTYIVPSELTSRPVLDLVEDSNLASEDGRRLLFLSWTFSAKGAFDGYSVTVAKASGEAPCEQINTTKPEVRLVLSYSAFHVGIRAYNNVSRSPAVNKTIPQRRRGSGAGDTRLNVTVHSNKSFTVHWRDSLKRYVCYCVEWNKRGHKAFYKSFFENEKNYKTISISAAPVRAPANISSYNMTAESAVLEWSSIAEEDTRGFLLGYTIHYTEYGHSTTETNVTVGPEMNHYTLDNLKSGTIYELQISGFTQAGEGVRSTSYRLKTNQQGDSNSSVVSIIIIFAVVVTVLLFGPTIIKRTKVVVWPSIPNPVNSNAMKQMEGTCELELLESINTLKVEEWDTDSLQIIEKETVIPADSLPRLHSSEDEGSAPDWLQKDPEDAPGGVPPDAVSELPQGGFQSSAFTYTSEYTTMEMFNQMMPQCVQANTDGMEAERSDLTVGKLDYIRQFSSSPTMDSELSTFL
ncbi:oncostatin-M-specific receptor subunit beta isoform X2 [Betta splendens]|uniref:Oncostatin-M-specific receptor subunit beta isoform X2 n=1 Tax=Betta splendens TaxID=158456 RepID=A0A9W2Y5L6_BETSP|nr:oncostatin-M-specific receptor subunit beta isoform X2 [Betta splendens]